MPTLLELASNIVSAHASTSAMSKEELLKELQEVHNTLSKMEKGEAVSEAPAEQEEQPAVSMRKAFGKREVFCMICGRGGMQTLGRHIEGKAGHLPVFNAVLNYKGNIVFIS